MSRDDGLAQYPPLTAVDLDHRHVWGERWRDRQVPHRLGGSCHYRPPFPERSQVPPRTPGAAPVVGRRNVQNRRGRPHNRNTDRSAGLGFDFHQRRSRKELAMAKTDFGTVGRGGEVPTRRATGSRNARTRTTLWAYLASSNQRHRRASRGHRQTRPAARRRGRIPSFKWGHLLRFHPDAVGEWLSHQAVSPAIASSTGSRSRGEAAGIGVASGRRAEPSSA